MKKITLFLVAMLLMGVSNVWADAYPVNFDKETNLNITRGDRSLTSVSLTQEGKETQTIAVGTKVVWNDKTSESFTVEPGSTITASVVYAGSWMNAYVYVDEDNDNEFNITVDNTTHTATGDIKAFSFYSFNPTSDASGYNSKGEYLTSGNRSTVALSSFTAPEKEGTYRMRYKVDWNCIDPAGQYGSAYTSNLINANGGYIVDVTLIVEAPTTATYTVHIMGAPAPTKVTYNEQEYGNGDTFEATGFTVSQLTVPDHENYVKDVYLNGTDIYVSYTYAKLITSLADLSNERAYMVMCDRGQLTTAEGQLAATGTKSYTEGKSTFAFVKYEDAYYMWSTAENGFVFNDKTIATEGEFQTVGFTPQADGTFVLSLGGAEGYLNMQNGGNGLIINNYSTPDPGNKYNLYEVEQFDATAALALLTPAPEGWTGVVTSTLDDTKIKSWQEFNGIEVTFEGATTIEAFDPETGIYADLYYSEEEGSDYICDPYYNDEGLNCEVKVEGNKITLSGFFDPYEFFATRAQQRHMAKRGAEKDDTKPQYELAISDLKIDGKGQDVISLFFDAEGNVTVKFAPTAVTPEDGASVEGKLENVTMTFEKAVTVAEGKTATLSYMGDVERETLRTVAPTVSEDGLTATFAINATESSIYFLTLPEGLFTNANEEVSEAKEYTFTVKKAAPAEPINLAKVALQCKAGEYFGLNSSNTVAVMEEPYYWTFEAYAGQENAYKFHNYDNTQWVNTGSNGYLSPAAISQTNNIRNYYFYEATTTETNITGKLVAAPVKGKEYMIVVKNVNKSPNNGLYAIYCGLAKDKTDRFDVVKISDDETVIPAEFTLTTESESSTGVINFQKVVWNIIGEEGTPEPEPEPEVESVENVYLHNLDLDYLIIGSKDINVGTEPYAWNINVMATSENDAQGYSLSDAQNTLWLNSGSNGYLSKTTTQSQARYFYFYEATVSESGVEATLVDQPEKGGKYLLAVTNITPNYPGLYVVYGSLAKDKDNRLDVVKINDTKEVPETLSLTTANESSNGAISLNKVVWEIQDPSTVGISATATTTATNAIFNLQGQRIAKLQKGINIVGGQKVIR